MPDAPKKRLPPQILNRFNYRGLKITEVLNRKTGRHEYKARFQINNKEFNLTDDKRRHLEELIDETLYQERRAAHDFSTPQSFPLLAQLFEYHAPRIIKRHQRQIFERTAKVLLSLLPFGIKINELKKAHFQRYIDLRLSQVGQQTKQPILAETVDKELYSISSALKNAPRYFAELENYQKFTIPKAAVGKKRRRTRIVNVGTELDLLLAELRKPKSGKQTFIHEAARHRLADDLEFRLETGLRRIEAARLKKNQYFEAENALRDVIRWKTATVTSYFPLTRRACEIIESRLENKSEYIFTESGEPLEADYKTLKTVCKRLNIPYGRYAVGGFVAHDLRRNYASEIVKHTDIKTVQELLGHGSLANTEIYLRTDETRLKNAITTRDAASVQTDWRDVFERVKSGEMTFAEFEKIVKK